MMCSATASPVQVPLAKCASALHSVGGQSLALTITLLGCLASVAQERYVDDRIKLGLHASDDPASAVVQMLDSGSRLKLLEAKGPLSKVRTGNGTEGWVDSTYLSKEPPAAARLQKLQDQMKDRIAAYDALQAQFSDRARQAAAQAEKLAAASARESTLKGDLKDAREALALSQKLLQRAETKLAEEARAREKEASARSVAETEAMHAKSQTEAVQARISETENHARQGLTEANKTVVRISEQLEAARSARHAAESERDKISRRLDTVVEEMSQARDPTPAAPVPSATLREVQRMAEKNQRLKAELSVQAAALRAARDALRAGAKYQTVVDIEASAHTGSSASSEFWRRLVPGGWYDQYLSPYIAIARWREWQWLLLGAGMLLAAGLGAYWVDWGNRRRHGGFRI